MTEFLKNLDADKIKSWFDSKLSGQTPLFYNSVDVRNFGHKIAPVDTNIFPAGFNLLSKEAKNNATKLIKEYFEKFYPSCTTIGLITENFSRNKFYWENIKSLKSIIEAAGKDVLVGSTENLQLEDGLGFQVQRFEKQGDKLFIGGKKPCVVIANRDFTSGAPDEFCGITQMVIPPVKMGWYRRKKSNHFDSYNLVAKEFANAFDIDPWLISSYHTNCGKVDFKAREGIDCVATNVEKTLHKITQKYAEYNITNKPYVFIKSDSGTFGMGIMTVSSGDELYEMNKKIRNKMSSIKEGITNTQVIIQEGIPTIDKVNNNPAEPLIYLISNKAIGGVMRINTQKDEQGNLNSGGMEFGEMDCEKITDLCENEPAVIIAKLAGLAALNEVDLIKDAA